MKTVLNYTKYFQDVICSCTVISSFVIAIEKTFDRISDKNQLKSDLFREWLAWLMFSATYNVCDRKERSRLHQNVCDLNANKLHLYCHLYLNDFKSKLNQFSVFMSLVRNQFVLHFSPNASIRYPSKKIIITIQPNRTNLQLQYKFNLLFVNYYF